MTIIQKKKSLVFQSPLSGLMIPLYEIPDPVFAKKMVGDGVGIEPTSQTVLAPFDGEIIHIHPSLHALTLRSLHFNLDILIHVGIDTVNLKGEGFKAHVKQNDKVNAGERLISFDADLIAKKVPSLISPLILLPSTHPWEFEVKLGRVNAGDLGALTVYFSDKTHSSSSSSLPSLDSEKSSRICSSLNREKILVSPSIQVPIKEGLHARPISLILQAAKRFQAETYLHWNEKQASCRSLVQILELAVPGQSKIHFSALGIDAPQALKELERVVQSLKETHSSSEKNESAQNRHSNSMGKSISAKKNKENIFIGVPAAPGLAAGQAIVVRHQAVSPPEIGQGVQQEKTALYQSINQVRSDLKNLEAEIKKTVGKAQAAIFIAHQDILEDPQIIQCIEEKIDSGKSAAWSVDQVMRAEAHRLSLSQNELIATRSNDILDVNRRWVSHLTGKLMAISDIPPQSILIAEDLTPSDTATLSRQNVLGFCTQRGGATSHVAILARSLNIPALAAIDPHALEIVDGTPVLLNASEGYLELNPSPEILKSVQEEIRNKIARKNLEESQAQSPAITQDQHQIKVYANFSNPNEADLASDLGAEGVGLLRSEFLFLNRIEAPSEEEQYQIYSHITQKLGSDRPVTIRALDVGGDKPLSYCPMPKEENPFLGQRGIRMLLQQRDLLRTQIRALLRSSRWGPVRLLLPMITHIVEIRETKKILIKEANSLNMPVVPLGIMIEVPAAVYIADHLAKEVEFFSIGTNDLTQYMLAMDRNHPQLAHQVDALHPSVLKMIQMTCQAAKRRKIEVSVCGGLAGDEWGIPLLIGLGVDELSVSLPSVPTVKAQVRRLRLKDCQEWAADALEMASSTEVREKMKKWIF